MVLVFQPSRPAGRQATSPANASSVPGNKHTAIPRSSESAKPRVPVPKSRVTSLSPTFAGRERTLWRLKSHIGDSLSSQDKSSRVSFQDNPPLPLRQRFQARMVPPDSSNNGAARERHSTAREYRSTV